MTEGAPLNIGIVGAGVTGLTAAYELVQLGLRPIELPHHAHVAILGEST